MKRRLRLINFILMFVMCFGALGFMPRSVEAQDRAVEAGDVAIILINTDDADTVAFVALADIPAGTVIYFTDSEWIASTNLFRPNEGAFTYTVPSPGLSAGTIISKDGPYTSAFLESPWAVANDSYVGTSGVSLATGGDQILVFLGPTSNPSFLYALNDEGAGVWQADAIDSNTSALPRGLVNGTTAVAINEIDNARLKCTSELSGTKAELLAYISNKSNWEGSDTVRQSLDGSCSFTITSPDTAPTVVSTSPIDGATNVALDSNIVITFSEAMTLAADWFEIDCSVSGVHTAVVTDTDPIFTLNLDSDFVNNEVCTVTIFAALASDEDLIDPPDNLAEDYIFSFSTLKLPMINEVDSDTPGTDAAEFVELYDGGVGNTSLDGLVVVFFNGNGDVSYAAYDLDTFSTNASGYFVMGNASLVPQPSIIFGNNFLQNGADAVALYFGDATSFPNGTSVTTANLIDAIVYDTDDADDAGLLVLLNLGQPQVNENGGGDKDNHSIQRCPNGSGGLRNTDTYTQAAPTPGTENCPIPTELAPTVILTSPTNGATAIATDTNIEITFSEPVTVTVPWFSISCATSGIHTATVTDADPKFTLNPDTNFVPNEVCTVTVYATGVTDDDTEDPPDNMTADYVFSFTTGEACGDDFTPTYTIQGSGATSSLVGSTVAVEGVVVGDFTTGAYVSGGKNGFYIQDPTGDGDSATSDGLFIYSNLKDVQAGDHVRVAGTVAEYTTGSGSLTQVTSVSQVWTCATGVVVAPTVMTLPVPTGFNYETLEGMLVTFPQDLVISEYFNFDRYGEIVLTSERHMTPTALYEPGSPEYFQAVIDYNLEKITLDDGRTSQNPDPALHPNGSIFDLTNLFRGGSTVSGVTGILDFYQSLYRVQPTQGAIYTDTNPRTIAPDVEPGELTIASFNVLNYFLDIDSGSSSWVCGPSGNMECRGADTALELERQRAKILAAMAGIEADIYGLMEIQNDTGASTADLVAGLNDIFGAGTYDYIDTGYIGTDAIKQAIIYKPAAVTPIGVYEILDSSVDPRFIDTRNRPVLAQVFEDKITGETLIVAVNHLKSKGSACADDPDLGDGAGNCNLTRKAAAEALVDWLADATVFPGVTDSLVIGDLNSYDKEDPIDMIKLGADDLAGTDDDYIDMVEFFQGDEAYSYVFDGQVGYLDHALANLSLADNIVDVNFWHINADEADLIDYNMDFKAAAQDAIYAPDAYRSSDHDPVIITLTLNHAPVATPDAYQTDEDVAIQALAPGVLANDTDVNPNDTLTAELVTDVTSGTLVLNADGSFTYTPALNFFGEVTFTYRVFDGQKYSNTVTVTITVLPVNDSPVAEDDLYETDQDVTLVVPAPGVLENDSDPDPGDIFTVVLMTPTQHGTVILLADGSFIYTPAPGFSGTDTFIYALISMARGGYADTATVTIIVHPVYRYFLPLIVK